MARSTAAAIVALALALVSCGEGREIPAVTQAAQCARCHGDVEGSTGAPTQGAHATHVEALSGSGACDHCHPDPRGGSSAHMNGRVDVAFGALATRDAALPSRFDADTLSCSAVYCHGAFYGGNEENAPLWTSVGQGQGDCGTCHGLPPVERHGAVPSDLTRCASCHPSTVDVQGELIAGGDHLNGVVDGRDDDCTSCHQQLVGGAGVRSSHLAASGDTSGVCRTCHDASPEGHYQRPAGNDACLGCHGGHGEALGGRTPPLLVGWSDDSGDFHGDRAGSGYGGNLRPPYQRAQPALACTTCHDAHSSGNAFLLAGGVNGSSIPSAAIDRAGVGAEVLCNACHEGDRHAQCKSCHTAVKVDMGDGHVWFDSSAPRVDPAPPGYPCFWCHGHEGIVLWTQPGSIDDDMMRVWNESCDHCHSFRAPVVETVAPMISPYQTPSVSSITATTATVTWGTTEGATSYVAYGVETPAWIAGDGALVYQHSVTLTGLSPGTTYVWRIRMSDQFRNVTETPLQTFSTPGVQ